MKKYLAPIAIFLSCSVAQAAPLQITALPSSGVGEAGFEHNNFHDASAGDATDGHKISWFQLGANGGTYDNVTGDIILNIDMYAANDQAMSGIILDTAIGIGNIDPTAWDGAGGLIGSIAWTFAGAGDTVETFFYDVDYGATSDIGFTPNTQTSNSFTLWGSNGDLDPITGKYEGALTGVHPTIGVDFAVSYVPVPAAVWLFGSGLLAIAGFSRRQKNS